MPLPLPNLDDRRWGDLIDEGRALIPRYARQWTDHNLSDPGITLMELLAWMTEASLYGVNRITARHRERFLALIGFAPRPPQPALAMLRLTPAAGAAPFLLPAGVEFDVRTATGAVVPLTTRRAVTIADVRIAVVQIDENTGAGPQDWTSEWRSGLPVRVFGPDPVAGSAIYFGFESAPVQEPLSFAFRWDRAGADAIARAVQSASERERLIAEVLARDAACRVPQPVDCPDTPAPVPPSRRTPPHHSARVVWEAFTGAWTPLVAIDPPSSPAEGEVADDTRSLTLDGIVEMNLPAGLATTKILPVAKDLLYVRCRLEAGAFDAPPTLLDVAANAVPVEQAAVLTQRFTIPPSVIPSGTAPGVPTAGATTRLRLKSDGTEVLTALTFDPTAADHPDVTVIAFEKVPAVAGQITLQVVAAGRGRGVPEQEVVLDAHPLVTDDRFAVFSHDGTSWQRWDVRPGFDASTRVDWHCTLDPMRGVLTFGDGEHGRVLPSGHLLFVTGAATAGDAGAVTGPARLAMRSSAINARLLAGFAIPLNQLADMTTMAWPAAGGVDLETIAHASGRAAETLHAHERLVQLADSARSDTLDQIEPARVTELPAPGKAASLIDLERLALDVPGTRVARARAWPHLHAGFPCLSAPGSITVVIIPAMPVARPMPSRGLLRTVHRYLERRRLVATSLHVVGPSYVAIDVNARIRPRRGASPGAVRSRIDAALRAFLDPLRGGPAGLGWPFGRAVYRTEILELIDNVAGVDHVLDLSLSAAGGSGQCGNLTLCHTALAASGSHVIEVE